MGYSPLTSAPASSACSPPHDSASRSAVNLAALQSNEAGPSSTPKLPDWVRAAMEQDTRAQPWKHHTGAEAHDDPDFTQNKDPVTFYDDKIKVCYGEGSMAA